MATDPLQYPSSLAQHTLLVVTANEERRSFLAAQLDADGHTVYEADSAAVVVEGCRPVQWKC